MGIRLALATAVALALAASPAAADGLGPLPPPNPATGSNGAATMHNDSAASDSTALPGPGIGALSMRTTFLAAACPSILIGGDGYPVALCTAIANRAPEVHLLDPATGASLASLALPRGGLFSGVYTYLDDRDRLVLFDGNGDLIRVAHRRDPDTGVWSLEVEERTPLAATSWALRRERV